MRVLCMRSGRHAVFGLLAVLAAAFPPPLAAEPAGSLLPAEFVPPSEDEDAPVIVPAPADSGTGLSTGPVTYRTLCVRLCDGGFVQMSFATTPDHFVADADRCVRQCATPARLFFYPTDTGSLETMRDLAGRPYSDLPTAFAFRRVFDAACSCRGGPGANRPPVAVPTITGGATVGSSRAPETVAKPVPPDETHDTLAYQPMDEATEPVEPPHAKSGHRHARRGRAGGPRVVQLPRHDRIHFAVVRRPPIGQAESPSRHHAAIGAAHAGGSEWRPGSRLAARSGPRRFNGRDWRLTPYEVKL
jgi:hypothetical protein